jgi:sec-independent protein translocase protein TatB
MELSELKKLQEEARAAARTIESSLQSVQSDIGSVASDLRQIGTADAGAAAPPAPDDAWEGAGESWQSTRFDRRYKAGPSVDELAEEVARLKRELALPDAYAGSRRKYAPRARVNRPRIRR